MQDYEKAFTDEESYGFGGGKLYQTRGVSKAEGCVVVVRPDQYVSAVLPLAKDAEAMLEKWRRSPTYHKIAGRRLKEWAVQAGFEAGMVQWSAGCEVHTGEEGRAWGASMRRRVREDRGAREKMLASGWSEGELVELEAAWAKWVGDESAVYAMPCGQLLAWK